MRFALVTTFCGPSPLDLAVLAPLRLRLTALSKAALHVSISVHRLDLSGLARFVHVACVVDTWRHEPVLDHGDKTRLHDGTMLQLGLHGRQNGEHRLHVLGRGGDLEPLPQHRNSWHCASIMSGLPWSSVFLHSL